MHNKKIKKLLSLVLLGCFSLVLTACGNLQNSGLSTGNNGSNNRGKSSYQVTNNNNSQDYSTLTKGNRYQVSPIDGITSGSTENKNQFNSKSFESGLTDVSKKQFAPNKYLFQEGQLITSTEDEKWLARKSSDNPDGLNPVDNKKKGANERNPMYLSQIMEQDFYTGSGSKYSLQGISIGIALNKTDYYTKKRFGAVYKTHISDAEREKQGKIIADKIVKRMRNKKRAKNVPILVSLYTVADSDSLVGGTFFDYALSNNGQRGVSSSAWNKLNYKNQVLPTVNNEKPIKESDSDSFSNFKDDIQSYFPNISGVTAQTHYEDGDLKGMIITVSTQFYGVQQIRSFTQYVSNSANKMLPSGVQLEIRIQSADGLQSLITRDSGSRDMNMHVLSTY